MRNRMPQRKPEMQREAPFGQACGDQSWQPHWYSAFEDITGSVPAPKAHPKRVAVTREGTTLRGWKRLACASGTGSAGDRISRSGNGVRCGRITAPTARRGSFSLTITRGREHTGGAKTGSVVSATGTR